LYKATNLAIVLTILTALHRAECQTAAQEPTALQLDNEILKHRQCIQSGIFRVTFHSQFPGLPAGRGDVVTSMDGDRLREDFTQDGTVFTKVFNGPDYFECSRIIGSAGAPGVVMRDRRSIDPIKSPQYRTFKPLNLMCFPVWYMGLSDCPIDALFTSPARRENAVRASEWNGHKAWEVSCIYHNSAGDWRIHYLVVPELGYSVVRMESEDYPKPTLKAVVECSVAPVGKDCWFPSAVHFDQISGTGHIKEDLSISADSVNQPIDKKVFEPAGLAIPVNTRIARIPPSLDGNIMKWDGSRIVPLTVAERMGAGARPGSRLATRLAFICGSAAFMVVAIVLFWRSYCRKPDP
jgi:hypothetical protein